MHLQCSPDAQAAFRPPFFSTPMLRIGYGDIRDLTADSAPHIAALMRATARPPYAGSCSRLAIIALNAGRAWQASSQAFTRGAAENSSGAAIA